MKIFENKFLVKLIASLCLFLTILNFTGVSRVYAADDDKVSGGVLIKPIVNLMVSIGDSIMEILHSSISNQEPVFAEIDGSQKWWEWLGGKLAVVAGIVAAVLVVVGIGLFTAGVGLAVAALTGAAATATFTISLGTVATGVVAGVCVGKAVKEKLIPDDISLPLFSITPEEIFSGNIKMFDVNFFTQTTDGTTGQRTIAEQLRNIIATWYFILRNIALLVLMLLLIYIGIRIAIGSTAGEKAKYKERLIDWIVALCLLFIMHYIMIFAVEIVERVTELVDITTNQNMAYIELTEKQYKSAEETLTDFEDERNGIAMLIPAGEEGGGEHGALLWRTDLAGLFRIQAQITESGTKQWVAYSLCYVVLVLFTLFFSFTYFRRIIYMAFLTMIAPLVAMTYPIDKITDGKAQAFDMWLKEYIFNLLIQPMHLLLYTILITSAYTLASESPVYALAAMAFMMPAEKLMRRFFGFEKAKTPGLLGGAAGAAIAMSGLQGILKHRPQAEAKVPISNNQNSQNKVKLSHMNKNDATKVVADRNTSPENKEVPKPEQQQDKNTDTETNNESDNNLNENEETHLDLGAATNGESYNEDASANTEADTDMDVGANTGADADFDAISYGGIDVDTDAEAYPETDVNADEFDGENIYNTKFEDAKNKVGKFVLGEEGSKRRTTQKAIGDALLGKEGSKRRRINRATGKVMLDVGKQTAARVLTGVHPIKLAGRVALGATAATAGLLIGTASGEPNKAFQYTAAGAMGGNALAKALSEKKVLNGEELREEYQREYYGDEEYVKKQLEKQKKQFIKDKERIDYLRKTTGIETDDDAKKVLAKCYDSGVEDVKDIATIYKLTKGDKGNKQNKSLSFKEALAARSYAKTRLGGADTDSMEANKIRNYKNRWANEFLNKKYADTDEKAKEMAEDAWNLAVRFNQTANRLTKR